MRRWWRSSRSAAIGVVIGDGGDDRAVLGEHLAEVAGLGQAEQPDAVELPAWRCAQPPGDLAARQVAEQRGAARRRGGRRRRRRRGLRALLRGEVGLQRRRARSGARARAPRSGSRRTPAPRARTAASATASSSMSVTNVPSCGTIATSRSSRSRTSASRTGVRLTPSRSASSFSDSRRPGSSSALTIASRSAA